MHGSTEQLSLPFRAKFKKIKIKKVMTVLPKEE